MLLSIITHEDNANRMTGQYHPRPIRPLLKQWKIPSLVKEVEKGEPSGTAGGTQCGRSFKGST